MPRPRTKAEQAAYDKKHEAISHMKTVRHKPKPKPKSKPKLVGRKIASKATRLKRVKAGYAKNKQAFTSTRTEEIATGTKGKNPYRKNTPQWRKFEKKEK